MLSQQLHLFLVVFSAAFAAGLASSLAALALHDRLTTHREARIRRREAEFDRLTRETERQAREESDERAARAIVRLRDAVGEKREPKGAA